MTTAYVPVTMGSARSTHFDAGLCSVVDASFPPLLTLPPHFHERASFAVILNGSFEGVLTGKRHDCLPGTVLTEPAGERHGNLFQRAGARVLVVQPDPTQGALFRPCASLLERVNHFREPAVAEMAWRLTQEVRNPDAVTPLAVEGLVLEMLARAARRDQHPHVNVRPPSWLLRAEELLRGRFLERIRLADVARVVGIHPVHLARVFRAHYRSSIGAFVRRLRLDWAAVQLASSDKSISEIALIAEFADQSHFTRAFRRHTGFTPARYRRDSRD